MRLISCSLIDPQEHGLVRLSFRHCFLHCHSLGHRRVSANIEQAQRSKKKGFRARLQSVRRYLSERGRIPSPSGRQESAFSGRQMGLVQKEKLVVFNMGVPRETERQQRKKWETQEDLASNQP